MNDIELIQAKLAAIIGADCPSTTKSFVHEGEPVSKSRARFSPRNGRFYTPAKTSNAEDELAWRFHQVCGGETLHAGMAIVAIFFRPNRQRIDADNMMKLVMDAATKARIWRDDCYVFAQASFVEMDPQNPRTLIAFCPISSSMDRDPSNQCTVCGKEIRNARIRREHRRGFRDVPHLCSAACRKAQYDQQRVMFRCAKCGNEAMRRTAGQRYCSRICALTCPLRRQKNAIQRPWPKCIQCGGRVSRREYMRCSTCSSKGRKLGSKNKPKADVSAVKL